MPKLDMKTKRLEIRKKNITMSGVSIWTSLPIAVLEARNLTGLRTELDNFVNGIV